MGNAPKFVLPTTVNPIYATKEALEDGINGISTSLYNLQVAETTARISGDDAHSEGLYYAGPWDASTGSFPTTRTQGGNIQNGDIFVVSVGGIVDGVTFVIDERITALVDTPSATTYAGNWFQSSTIASLTPVTERVGSLEVSVNHLENSAYDYQSYSSAIADTQVFPIGAIVTILGTLHEVVASGGDVVGVANKFADLSKRSTTSFSFWASQPDGTEFVLDGYRYVSDSTVLEADELFGAKVKVVPLEGGIYPVAAYAIMDPSGVVDHTLTVRRAVADAQLAVRDAASPTFNKQLDGAIVLLPKGLTRITDTITVSESNIHFKGLSSAASALYAPNANFDLLKFENVSYALYNCSVSDMRFLTSGNATSGYCLKVIACIYFNHFNTIFNGWWGGIYIGGGGKIYNSNVHLSQETRDVGTPLTESGLYISGDRSTTGDVHFTDCQFIQSTANSGQNVIIIRCCDGLYFNNVHCHGRVLVEPRAVNGENTLVSLVFANSYLDGSRDSCLQITGSVLYEYRDIRITNTYIRGGVNGVRINPTSIAKFITFTGGKIAQNTQWGIEILNANVQELKVDGVSFDNNNTNDTLNVGDIRWNGFNGQIMGATFEGGYSTGRSVQIDAGANYTQLRDLTWVSSAVSGTNRFVDGGANTKKSNFVGFNLANKGTAAVASGVTSVTFNHGLALTPTAADIKITPIGNVNAWWVSSVTSSQVTVTFSTAVPSATTLHWSADVQN